MCSTSEETRGGSKDIRIRSERAEGMGLELRGGGLLCFEFPH